MTPSLVMVTTGISWALSLTARTFGTSTSRPNSMTCAVSMKMMSSTSTTSTNGVTLISAMRVAAAPAATGFRRHWWRRPSLLSAEAALGQVEELEREIVHARAQFADQVAEIVIEDGRRDGGEQADRGGDQRLGDARCHGFAGWWSPSAPRSWNARMMPITVPINPINGVTEAVVASQFMLRSSLASSSLTPSCSVRSRAVRLVTLPRDFHLPLHLFVAEIEDRHQGRRAELFARDHHGFHAGGLAKRAQEARIGLAGGAQGRRAWRR